MKIKDLLILTNINSLKFSGDLQCSFLNVHSNYFLCVLGLKEKSLTEK